MKFVFFDKNNIKISKQNLIKKKFILKYKDQQAISQCYLSIR
jgi:hypothetical protein